MKKKKLDKDTFWSIVVFISVICLVVSFALGIHYLFTKCNPHEVMNYSCLEDKARVICEEEYKGSFYYLDDYYDYFQCLEDRQISDAKRFTEEELESCKEMTVCEEKNKFDFVSCGSPSKKGRLDHISCIQLTDNRTEAIEKYECYQNEVWGCYR